MSDISNQLIKDSYNYVLQSDLSTGIVYRIGGGIPVNPKFLSGLTINSNFNYSNGTEQPGYVLITDAFGNATWGPISGSSSGDYLSLSGGTVTGATRFTGGLTANTFSASTYLGLPIDIRVTGATKSGSVATFTNNTGGTFTLTGLTDVFVTGATKSGSVATFTNNTGGTFTLTGLTDVFVTGGTYSSSTGVTTFRNNTGGTFTVTGYFTPSNDIYVTSGQVDHGPSNSVDNSLILTRSDLTNVTISNLVNISDTTKSQIDSLIGANKIIRGKTYKISGCDTSLYYNGTDRRDDPVYTTIYLMGLESDKLSESGVGVFYTPKYSDFDIFRDGVIYGIGDKRIWGGYVWTCIESSSRNSIDLFTLDPRQFEIIYPFNGSDDYLSDLYNIQYDDIIYDYTNDRIIYRNEENSNIVSTTTENINYWINNMGFYNPIRVFQWGNVYNTNDDKPNGIGKQTIINSYNENINYNGKFQKDFYFNNLSYQRNVYSDTASHQELFYFNNLSYQDTIQFPKTAYQKNINLINSSYQSEISFGDGYQIDIILENQSYQHLINIEGNSYQENFELRNDSNFQNILLEESSSQKNIVFDNGSYQNNISLSSSAYQNYFNFNNGFQTNIITSYVQSYINIENGSQNNLSENQNTITIKGYDLDWSSYTPTSPQTDLFFIHNLPSETTSTLIGKKNNQLIEVSDLYYDGVKWILNGDIVVGGLTATTISATTYLNLPSFTGAYLPLSGGTVFGPTIFTSGVTANTISEVNYINFKTSPTVPNPTGGTLYFDSNENALSYKPITNQNDVTVNLGQESLIRIFNNLPYQINNGQVLHITGSTTTGGTPTVALANASKLGTAFTESLAQTSGVATHNIPSGQFGFMTNFGVVRDLNTSAFTAGQEVFLSDTVDGALTNDPNNIAFTSRVSTVGYCLESSPTTGKILVVITNENPLQSLTQQEVNVLLGNTISTGAYFYTGTTTASTTTINVSPVRGWVVYNTGINATNPLVLNVYYSGGTNLPVSGLTTSFDTYLLVNSGGTLYQTNSYPTPIERRQNIFLCRIVHPNKTTILNVEESVDFDVSPYSSLRDLWVPLKLINENVVPSPNGATLTFKTSSGTFWGNGIGFPTNELNPNSIIVPAYIPASFYYTTQTGGTFTSTTTTVDTTNYDVGGVITNVPGSGNYTTQRIYMSQSGVIRLQYGQTFYPTLAKAIAAIPSETFVVNPDNALDCILIGLLTVKDGTSDLSNTDDAIFTFVSKFGDILGGTGGIATTTLQQAYNNSIPPEILTNSTLGALTIQNGTGNPDSTSNLYEGANTAGTITSFITASGGFSGSSISATTITSPSISPYGLIVATSLGYQNIF